VREEVAAFSAEALFFLHRFEECFVEALHPLGALARAAHDGFSPSTKMGGVIASCEANRRNNSTAAGPARVFIQ